MTHYRPEHPTRFLQTRYQCTWCDTPISPDETLCYDCQRAELDRALADADSDDPYRADAAEGGMVPSSKEPRQ